MLYITRKEHFSSSHKLNNPQLSDKDNDELFGKCNSIHGHNYYLEVTIAGTPDKISGYVFDLKMLKTILYEKILNLVDHKFLNEIKIFEGIIPTTENIAVVFWNILEPLLKKDNCSLYSIKIFETEKNSVTYKGNAHN